MQFQNGWTDPIRIENSSYLSFKNCHFAGGRRVIRARDSGVHHILVENCFWDQGGQYLWDFDRWMNMDAWDEMHSGSLRFFNGSLFTSEGTDGGHVIRGNTILHAFNALRWRADQGMDKNIEIYENRIENIRDNDFEPEDYTSNLFIHHNQSHNVHKTLSIDNVNGGNVYFFGNTITTDTDEWTREIATGFYKIYGENQNVTNPIYIFNNSYFGTGGVHRSIEDRTITNIIHVNNAFELTERNWELNQWNETLRYDYDCSNKPFSTVLAENDQQINGIVASPDFIDGINRDLKLSENSPCVDAGTIVSIPVLNWEQSFSGDAPDIGAYDSNSPISGPFFRVEETSVPELPRITLVTHEQDSTDISFSTPLLIESIAGNVIKTHASGTEETITNFVLTDNGHTIRFPNGSNNSYEIIVKNGLTGQNGQSATNWGNYSRFEFEEKNELVNLLLYSLEGGDIMVDTDKRILEKGTTIQLSAEPRPGYEFVKWEGDLESVEKEVSLEVDHSMWIIAQFKEVEKTLSTVSDEQKFHIYPNPSKGKVHLNGDQINNLHIRKLSGELVYSYDQVVRKELDLNHLPSGIYLISFSHRKKSITKKLIIE